MFIRKESFREFIRFYPIVSAIIAIHIALYLLTILPFFPNQWFYNTLSGVNLYIMEGEVWRLITPTFMHSGFSHMLFNSLTLVFFGPALERMIGSFRFLLIYIVSGLIANIATLLLEPPAYTHVGSSGAIFGLFGYYIAIIMFRKRWISQENMQLILILCVINLIMTFLQPNINVTAHLFGLLGGFLMGTVLYFNRSDWEGSLRDMKQWAGRSTKNFSSGSRSPLRMIFWGAVILFAIIGILKR